MAAVLDKEHEFYLKLKTLKPKIEPDWSFINQFMWYILEAVSKFLII